MVYLHNSLLRGLNSIYHNAPHIPTSPTDPVTIAYIGFTKCWLEFLHEHHETEEEIFFPEVDKMTMAITGEKGLMETNVAQHRQFDVGLAEMTTYIEAVQQGEKDIEFDGKKFQNIIERFGAVFTTHLTDEIPTLVSLQRFGDKFDVDELWEKVGKQAQAKMGLTDVLPLFFFNHDVTFEDGEGKKFPPMPAPVQWGTRYVASRWNEAWWKFAACDKSGKPQPLWLGGKD
jgi:Hemerythrin HHE cation binding domain